MTGQTSLIVHGTCIARASRAALITGPSGSGKSDLALRFLDRFADAHLVADDQVALRRAGDGLLASSPGHLAGLLEVRGLGLVHRRHAPARLCLMVELASPGADLARLAEPDWQQFLDIEVPTIPLAGFEASAPLRLALALETIGARGFPGEDGLLR